MVIQQDLSGKRFGKLIAVELDENKKDSNGTTKLWRCKCDCGNIVYRSARILNEAKKKGKNISCGCAKKVDLAGAIIGDYTINKFLYSNGKTRYWECKCKCGDILIKSTGNLVPAKCICRKERHDNGKYRANIRHILEKMKDRCYNINCKDYMNYGGRGISICKEWLNCSDTFIDWALKNGYKKGLTIDRIDNNNGYSPENCRWVDMITQNNNKRNNLRITYNGETKNLKQWCRELNLPYRKTHKRLYSYNWSIDKSFDERERVGFI